MKTNNKKLTKDTQKIFEALTPEDIIEIKNGEVFVNLLQIPEENLKSLKEEIDFIERTQMWKIITNAVGMKAKDQMFNKSETFDDMLVGKITLYVLSLQEGIMSKIKNYLSDAK